MVLSNKNTKSEYQSYLELAISAAQKACNLSLKYISDSGILKKNGKDLKTEVDIAMNNVILEELLKTGVPILSEETGFSNNQEGNLYWIVDPLDGTMNFSRRFPFYAVSIGMIRQNQPVLGVIIDIHRKKIYSAIEGFGAFLNKKKISVSDISQIHDAVLCTGFPTGSDFWTIELSRVINSIKKFKKVRMLGSAALMLTTIAEGIFDVYYENDIYLWDVAPALCIIKEAGGYVSMHQNEGFKYEVLASNMKLSSEAQRMLLAKKKLYKV